MARSRFITRTVRAPSPTIRISAPAPISRRAGRRMRRVGRGIASAASTEKHTLWALGAAAALGYAEKEKMAIPQVLGLSIPASAGLIAWGVGKFTRNRTAMHMATGLLCVAINRWASGTSKVSGVGVGWDDDDV